VASGPGARVRAGALSATPQRGTLGAVQGAALASTSGIRRFGVTSGATETRVIRVAG